MAPTFDILARDFSGLFARLDIQEQEDIALGEGVSVIPAFHIYRHGKKVAELVGEYETDLINLVQKHCA
jgi:thioredoxin-like negative regulator of GroEL